MTAPTLINLPPPPSDPVTPSDFGPGTPNSTTTSLSALSTTAIKDGHQGHAPPHHHDHPLSNSRSSSTNTLDAERADRISRLAGLERVATIRQGPNGPTSAFSPIPGQVQPQAGPGYFDNTATAMQAKERSTVGSASATGSVGGGRTWASSSDVVEGDKMSEDQDDGVSSSAGLSDEGNASLVGFGEGAGSTVSGPVSSRRTNNGLGSPTGSRGVGGGFSGREGAGPMQGVQQAMGEKARMTGKETSERIVEERMQGIDH